MPYVRRTTRRRAAPRRTTRRVARPRTRKHKTRGLASSRTKRVAAPVSYGTQKHGGGMATMSMHQINDTCTRVVGRSYIGPVTNNKNATVWNSDEIGLVFDVNPTLLGDRLAAMASTYDKYCYQSLKFTYVPQCPTSQPGSVVLAFERDPQAILANPSNDAKYMQEIMSYEHAVMTPCWESVSVTYKRDPHEYKTWFMSGDQAAITTRETSQGLVIAYCTNLGANVLVKAGFIVMDYVLDLVSPNIMPSLASPVTPTQFARSTNTCLGITSLSTATTSEPVFQISGQTFASGDIIECVYAGATACTGFTYYLGSGTGTGVAGPSTPVKINPGDKLYIAVGVSNDSRMLCIVSTNLSTALGAWSGPNGTAVGGVPASFPSGALFANSTASSFNPFTNGGTANSQWLYWRKISNTAQIDTA